MDDAHRTVFVTGASRGIGLSIADVLLAAGYRVVGVARRATTEFDHLRRSYGERAQLLEADLATADGLTLAARGISKCQTTYALVNNAGRAGTGLHVTLPRTELDAVMAVNLTAPMVLSQAAAKAMLRRRRGRIVTITSVCAQHPYRGLGVYSASKAALEGFTRVLAAECGAWGITANCVAPGFIETDMTAVLDDHTAERIRRRSMLRNPTTAADVAHAVEFLLSDRACTVTAEVIRVDGGSAA